MLIRVKPSITADGNILIMVYAPSSEDRTEGELLVPEKGWRWGVKSGPHGKGPAPPGIYKVDKPVTIEASDENKPFTDTKGFAWWAALTPAFETERSGFGIHPDGNVPGSKGCIALCDSDTKPAFDALTEAHLEPGTFLIVM